MRQTTKTSGEKAVKDIKRADILGQIAEHLTEAARIGNSIRDAELETPQADRQFKEQVVTTQKQLERVEVRAPIRGLVHELQTVTVGGVAPAGTTIAQIIANDANHSFEFRVVSTLVDQVFIGQPVRLRFSVFNHRTTLELLGEVSGVSPTTLLDETTRAPFYRLSVQAAQAELARLGDLQLMPGMPIEDYIGTGAQSVASYLTKPIVEPFRHAFREEQLTSLACGFAFVIDGYQVCGDGHVENREPPQHSVF